MTRAFTRRLPRSTACFLLNNKSPSSRRTLSPETIANTPSYHLLDNILSGAAAPEYQPDTTQSAAGLESLLGGKLQSFREAIADIDLAIQQRTLLAGRLRYEISQHYCYVKTKLLELAPWPLGGSRAIESRRSELERCLDDLLIEDRQERQRCWQDIQMLKKELRRWRLDYSNLSRKLEFILPSGQH